MLRHRRSPGARLGPVRVLMLGLMLGWALAAAVLVYAGGQDDPPSHPPGHRPDHASVAGTAREGVDLSGIWRSPQDAVTFASEEPPMKPAAEAAFKASKPAYGPRSSADSTDPILRCLPPGVPRILLMPFPMQIVTTPNEIMMVFEYDHYVRHIYMDRHEHLRDLSPTWMGDSIGRWDGNTLVVDSVGFNDKSWLDQVGHPHSDALHVTERIRRVDRDTLQDDMTIDDPKDYTRPWTGQRVFKLRPGWQLIEYICEDNMDVPR